jgi:hypothetical protein
LFSDAQVCGAQHLHRWAEALWRQLPPFFTQCHAQPNTDDLRQRAEEGRVAQPFIFRGVEFRKPLDLFWVTFDQGVQFRRCIFHESVNFSGAHFHGSQLTGAF